MSICDKSCVKCAYFSHAGSYETCDFFLITRERRGCPAGKDCVRRTAGEKIISIDQRSFLRPPEKSEVVVTARAPLPPEAAAQANREQHRRYYARMKNELGGRQRAALQAFKQETGYTNRKLALALGLSLPTVNGWMTEGRPANWKKLETVGCKKPEGL